MINKNFLTSFDKANCVSVVNIPSIPSSRFTRSILFRAIADFCCEKHTGHTKTLHGQNVELLNVTAVGEHLGINGLQAFLQSTENSRSTKRWYLTL
jgi:hypothetical protein